LIPLAAGVLLLVGAGPGAATAAAPVAVVTASGLPGVTVQPTGPVRVTGRGFRAQQPVRVLLDGVQIATTTAGDYGRVFVQVRVPAGTHPGMHTLAVRQVTPARFASTRLAVHVDWPMSAGNTRASYSSALSNTLGPADATSLSVLWHHDQPGMRAGTVVNGVVYISWALQDAYHDEGAVYALDAATGKQLWRSASPVGPISAAPTLFDGKLWVIDTGGEIHNFDPATGEQIGEEFHTDCGEDGNPNGLQIAGDLLVCVRRFNTAVIDPHSRRQLWSAQVGDGEPVAVIDGTIFAGGSTLTALDLATGKVRWTAPAPEGGRGTRGPVAAGNGQLYASWSGGQVGAYDQATGTTRWLHQSTDQLGGGHLAVFNDTVYVVGFDQENWTTLHALDTATGQLRWTGTGASESNLIAVANGVVYYNIRGDDPTVSFTAADAATGKVLGYSPRTPLSYGGLSIADGHLYFPDGGFTAIS